MSVGFHHRIDDDGVLHVAFDLEGEKVNLLNAQILESLSGLLDEARGRDDVRGVVFSSEKPGVFLAGMDVEQIGSVTDTYEAAEGARRGQAVLHQIAELGKPSVCAINGTCLGGGTELALACSFRLAAEGAKPIGLPEVKLGIIPGFGGTQRMPRLLGLLPSLDLILSGKNIDAKRAKRVGLVDAIVPGPYLEREATALVLRALEEGIEPLAAKMRPKRKFFARMADTVGPVRSYVLEQARKRTASKVNPEHYPAPFRALEAIEIAMTQPIEQGLDSEARIIGELIPTPTTRSLIWLFRTQNALKNEAGGITAVPRKVKRIGVIGAGIMGGGIAQLAADKGLPVRLKDIRYDAVLTALRTAGKVWDYKLKRKRMTKAEFASKMGFIAPTLDDSGLRRVDMVIEAVVERLDIKQKVLAELEQRIDERAVFASNTSSLPIGDIAARAMHPERVVGMHFFNPVHRMPLVEVIAGQRSSPEAVATVHALAKRMGKVPVIVQDGPGFLVNRVLTFYLFEAMQLLREGVRIEAADKAMVAFGMPMGPFALLDQVGLDTAKHVGDILRAGFPQRVGGEESVVDLLVAAGKLGQKNGKGFYRYRDGKRTTADPDVYRLVGDPATRDLPPEMLQERMVLAMLNEAAMTLQDGVVREPAEVDIAMVMGTGFPPFRGGLLRHADAVGIPIVADRLARLCDAHGVRYRPAELWTTMVREQARFYPD